MTARLTRPVALYARVSTRDKNQDPELQLVPLRAHAARQGWETVEYVDEASAGDLAHRTAWRRLLDDTKHRRVGLVLVWKLDRAFRSTLDALSTLQGFDERGVGFSAITQPELDTTTPAGKLMFVVLAAVAEMEKSLIADRVREGMRNARAKGFKMGRPSAATRPQVVRLLPQIRAEIAAGTLSRRQAAKRLGVGTATLVHLLDAA
jgi:DNA invertase Pin-like site-specific DNA recombinase